MERVPQASNLVSNALYLVLLQEQTGIAVEKIRLLIRQVFPDSCRLPRKHQKADVLVFHSLDPLPFNYIALFRSNCQIKNAGFSDLLCQRKVEKVVCKRILPRKVGTTRFVGKTGAVCILRG
jgi:hypothetical protein